MKTPKNIVRPEVAGEEPMISLTDAVSMLDQRVIEAHRLLSELEARLRPALAAEPETWGCNQTETSPVGKSPLATALAILGERLSRLNARLAFLIDSLDLPELPAADLEATRRVVG